MKRIVIVGNPNCGKSTLFTKLTGVYQKTNNYPGVTVEKKEALWTLDKEKKSSAILVDLPGLYSLYPMQEDEVNSYRAITSRSATQPVDLALVVVDSVHLKRNLLLFSQVKDMGLPIIVVLTMNDIAIQQGIRTDEASLAKELGVKVVSVNSIKGLGIDQLSKVVEQELSDPPTKPTTTQPFISDEEIKKVYPPLDDLKKSFPSAQSGYEALHLLMYPHLYDTLLSPQERATLTQMKEAVDMSKVQAQLIMERYEKIRLIVGSVQKRTAPLSRKNITDRLDSVLLHPFFGYVILFVILLGSFQFLFYIAAYPMEWIDSFFAYTSTLFTESMPDVWWSSLWINGLWAGLNGILVFVPQIALLFGIIAILEASGYMSRMNFLLDRWTRLFGLSGKSVVVFSNAFACAVPAIMSARNIEHPKERLITILVSPFMSCSARLPVYVILISLLHVDGYVLGFIQIKALIFLGLYLFGMVIAFGTAFILKFFIKQSECSVFLQELPIYRVPYWKKIIKEMYNKSKVFVIDAGKIILVISLVIWFLSSFGSGNNEPTTTESAFAIKRVDSIDHSYMGAIGQWIEPVIRPLGYDWQIGVALLTSFAAREVFVGTLSTIYRTAEGENSSLISYMRTMKRADGSLLYSTATILSLLVFYVLAMQCMSTLAVVKRETLSWKYPLAQFIGMTLLAYALARLTFVLAS